MKRNLFRLAMCIALTLAICPVLASAADLTDAQNVNYTITDSDKKEVKVVDSLSAANTVTIPEKVTIQGTEYTVTAIGEKAFYCNGGLTAVTIPASVTSIGENAFGGDKSLTGVTFAPDSKLTEIGKGAFAETALTAVTIPASVASIGKWAFVQCGSLTNVTMLGGNPPTLGTEAFVALVITVPFFAESAYKNADGWKDLTIQPAEQPVELVEPAQDAVQAVVLDEDGNPVATVEEGTSGTIRYTWDIQKWDSSATDSIYAYVFNFDALKEKASESSESAFSEVDKDKGDPASASTISLDLTDIPKDNLSTIYYAIPFYGHVSVSKDTMTSLINKVGAILSGSVETCNINK